MSLNFAALSPKDAIGFIVETFTNPLIPLHRPLLHGVQGVGKSSILRPVARLMDADLYDLRLVPVHSTVIRGLTVVDPVTGTTKLMFPVSLPLYTTSHGPLKHNVSLAAILPADHQPPKTPL